MLDVKKAVIVFEDDTTKEFDCFIGAFIDEKNTAIMTKDVNLSNLMFVSHVINKELDKRIVEAMETEEC